MDDAEEKRIEREARELKRMEELLKASRQRVGIESDDLKAVVAAALARAGGSLDTSRAGEIGDTESLSPGRIQADVRTWRLAGSP